MALEGSLKEFNVADILQLIFFQKKTGVLALNGRHDKVRVLFSQGNIVGGESKKRSYDRKLGLILMKRGLIVQEQIDATIEKQRTEGGKFGAILVRQGNITKEQMQEVLTFQITEVMVQVFSMKEGFYEFKPQAVPIDKEAGVELNTEHFLMEGVRLLDEMSELEGKISLDDLYMLSEGELPVVELDEKETKVLKMVDGERIVAEITDLTGVDSFTVCKALLKLAEAGAVYRHVEEEEEDVEVVVEKKDIPGLKVMIYAIILIAMAVSFVYGNTAKSNDYDTFMASQQMDAMLHDLHTGYYLDGAYPEIYDEVDPWYSYYLYQISGDDVLLMSAGPDGEVNTADDLPPVYGFFVDDGSFDEVEPEPEPETGINTEQGDQQ